MRQLILAALLMVPCSALAIRMDLSDITVINGGADIRPLANTWTGAYNDFSNAGEVRLSSGTNSWTFTTVGESTLTLRMPLLAASTFYFRASGEKIRLGANVEPQDEYDIAVGSLISTDTIDGNKASFEEVALSTLTAENIFVSSLTAAVINVTTLTASGIDVSTLTVLGKMTASEIEVSTLTGFNKITAPNIEGSTVTVTTVKADRFMRGGSVEYLLPSGAIVMSLGACPSGWTEITSARGFHLVGVPSGGTVGGSAGSAMTNLENRSHNHGSTTIEENPPGNVRTVGYTTSVDGHYVAPYIQVRLCTPP